MPLPIQRVPRGLSDILSIFGGESPRQLSDQVVGTLDLLQLYGLSQRIVIENNGVVAFGGSVASTGLIPARAWFVLYGMDCQAALTATATSMAIACEIRRQAGTPQLYSYTEALTPTVIPGIMHSIFYPPIPMICPPGTVLACRNQRLGVDANVNIGFTAEIGLLS